MTLTLSDPQSGTDVELYHADELRSDVQGSVEPSPPPGFSSDEPFLTQLTQDGRVTITGEVSANELTRSGDYSSDPRTALAGWLVRFESFLNGAQGKGYDLALDYRSMTYQGYIETLEWSYRGGEPYTLGFNLEFQRGTGFGAYQEPTFGAVSPTGTWRVNGVEIPYIREVSVTKSQEIEATRRTFADSPGANDITSTGGAVREINLTGQNVGTDTERNAFRDSFTDVIGQDTIVTVEDGLTGRTYDGMITSYEGTDEAGFTRIGDFGLQFVEGQNTT